MTKLIYVAIISAFVNNVVLGQMFGVNIAIKGSEKISTALRLSLCVLVLTFLSSLITWPLNEYVLNALSIPFLQTALFLLVECLLIFIFMKFFAKRLKKNHEEYKKLMPLILVNSAILGILLVNVQVGYSFARSMVNSVFGAVGFGIAVLILAGIRERVRINDVPKAFEGIPILLVSAGLMAIAFYGFTGLI